MVSHLSTITSVPANYSNQLLEIQSKYILLDAKKVPKRETIPSIFHRSWDENFISDYLAYILDPEKNGIGVEPLQSLLALAYEDIDDIDISQVNIIREYTFRKNPNFGRIDFVIELGDGVGAGIIGIENKIFSSEGENQTKSYVSGLQSDYPSQTRYMIFLTPTGILPIAKEFKQVSYANLLIEFRKIQYPVLKDIQKTVIWEDFLNHLEEYIVMSNGKLELSGKTQLYLEHQDMMSDINASFKDDSQKVYDYVTSSIKIKFGPGWYCNFQGRNEFQEILRESWRFTKYYYFFQYFFSKENILLRNKIGFILGVYPKNDESHNIFDEIKANHAEILPICDRYQITPFPKKVEGTGSLVIAFKEYPIVIDPKDLTGIDTSFLIAIEEFSQFIPTIDSIINFGNHRSVIFN